MEGKVVGLRKEIGLSMEGGFVEAYFVSPVDEVIEVDVEGEVLMSGVLVGLGWGEELVVEVGAEGAEGAAVVVFFRGASVVDGEDGSGLQEGEFLVEEFTDGFGDLEALAKGPVLVEEG